jgi:hypothetical protein
VNECLWILALHHNCCKAEAFCLRGIIKRNHKKIDLDLAQFDILFCIDRSDIKQESFLYIFLLCLSLQIINLQLRMFPKFQLDKCLIAKFFNHLNFLAESFFIVKGQSNANMILWYYCDSKKVFYKASQEDMEYLI